MTHRYRAMVRLMKRSNWHERSQTKNSSEGIFKLVSVRRPTSPKPEGLGFVRSPFVRDQDVYLFDRAD